MQTVYHKSKRLLIALLLLVLGLAQSALAREVEYEGSEIDVRVSPGEPTQVQFPGVIAGGFKRKLSTLSLDRKDQDLIIFANEGISDTGEAIIVRLQDGRSYSVRVKRADADLTRDDIVKVHDGRAGALLSSEEEEPAHKEKLFPQAPASVVSGLMREMVLAAEFGKKQIPGYRISESYKGQTVLDDGTIQATVDKIFIGPNLWGYVLDARNMLETTQKINAASFRLDGTRAVSAEQWELAPRPLNVEEQVSARDRTKVYVVTRAKK